jgi:catechol 2,3-dioxygenase-like lactoylglutathione lyase family enzyme
MSRLDHVVIAVSDWDRSIRFYRNVMGAQVVDYPDGRLAFRFGHQQLNVHGPGLDVGTLSLPRPSRQAAATCASYGRAPPDTPLTTWGRAAADHGLSGRGHRP